MSTPYLLHLETATTNCSVAVSKGEELLYCKESNSPDFRHSDYLHLFIEEALAQAGVKINALDGVGVRWGWLLHRTAHWGLFCQRNLLCQYSINGGKIL